MPRKSSLRRVKAAARRSVRARTGEVGAWVFDMFADVVERTAPRCHVCGDVGPLGCFKCGRQVCPDHSFVSFNPLAALCHDCESKLEGQAGGVLGTCCHCGGVVGSLDFFWSIDGRGVCAACAGFSAGGAGVGPGYRPGTKTDQRPFTPPRPIWAFDVFGLNIETATEVDINREFRRLALRNHPDVGGDPVKFKEINAAREECLKWLKGGHHG